MNCALCHQTIEKYNPTFHHLKIDEKKEVDICSDCIDTFMKWQQRHLADLFPTKTMKKRYKK
ncbi:hypothetical protein HYV86_06840 [Candidatus Woesearchaeota archaeon]|nr:hypothetical protein [Candidatus Woesearchaeota archaeon]